MSIRFAYSLFEAGRYAEALHECEMALRTDRNNFDGVFLQGVTLAQLGDFAKARTVLKRAIKLKPDSLMAQTNLAGVFIATGDPESAAARLRAACALSPDDRNVLSNLASCLMILGQNEEAETYLQKLIALGASDPITRLNLSTVLRQRGDFIGATEQARAALAAGGQNPDAHLALGEALIGAERYEEALEPLDHAQSLDPTLRQAAVSKSNALRKLGRNEEAIACCTKTLDLHPDFADAWCARGLSRHDMNAFDQAIADFNRAIELNRNVAAFHYNLGVTYEYIGDPRTAISFYERALRLEPNFKSARGNLYMCLLISGDFERGWEAMEWRKKGDPAIGARQFPCPVWLGGKSLKGKTILIHWEQGLGDTIQFCRYIYALAAQGADVCFLPQAALGRLLKSLPARILTEADIPVCDFHCPLMSLPLALKTRLDSIPDTIPYLDSEPDLVETWRRVLENRLPPENLRVGIVWRGSGAGTLLGKSIPLRDLATSLQSPGVSLISLQKNDGAEELLDASGILDLGEGFDSGKDAFVDTAAVMKSLDVVITVDTSVAHLAGALGVPVWVLLKRVPDWRWLFNRDDSPWYPHMRLFRQEAINDWASAIEKARLALQNLLRSARQSS